MVESSILKELLGLTLEIQAQANTIHTKMELNQEGQLEALEVLVDKRGQVIQQLDRHMKRANFQWAEEDQQIINELKGLEHTLQPLLNSLYNSFAAQIAKLSLTKQASRKYTNVYYKPATEGSFIDQRK